MATPVCPSVSYSVANSMNAHRLLVSVTLIAVCSAVFAQVDKDPFADPVSQSDSPGPQGPDSSWWKSFKHSVRSWNAKKFRGDDEAYEFILDPTIQVTVFRVSSVDIAGQLDDKELFEKMRKWTKNGDAELLGHTTNVCRSGQRSLIKTGEISKGIVETYYRGESNQLLPTGLADLFQGTSVGADSVFGAGEFQTEIDLNFGGSQSTQPAQDFKFKTAARKAEYDRDPVGKMEIRHHKSAQALVQITLIGDDPILVGALQADESSVILYFCRAFVTK